MNRPASVCLHQVARKGFDIAQVLAPIASPPALLSSQVHLAPVPKLAVPLVKKFHELPSPKGLPVLDLLLAGGPSYLHEYAHKRHQQLGPIFCERLGGTLEAVFVADAEMIKAIYQNEGKYPIHMVPEAWTIYNEKGVRRGLFFMDGPEWSERRKYLNKMFLKPEAVFRYTHNFNRVITDLLDNWSATISDSANGVGRVENLERQLYCWSIETLGAMMFGKRLGCIEENQHSTSANSNPYRMESVQEFVDSVRQIFIESTRMQVIPPRLAQRLNLPVWRRFEEAADKALKLANEYVVRNINALKAEHGLDTHDYRQSVQMQVSNQNGGESVGETDTIRQEELGDGEPQGILLEMLRSGTMQEEDIIRIVTDLFLAAADTTSHATQWALYLMARNPQAQGKLLSQVRASLAGGCSERMTNDHLTDLSYARGIMKESLRLYPVAPFISRILKNKETQLGDYNIPEGKLVVMSLYTTGRDDKYFANASQFLPERWTRSRSLCPNSASQSRDIVNTHACLPFGFGARSCIGRRLAEMQMQFLLSRIVDRFEISLPDEREIGIKLRMITTPERPIELLIRKRD